MASHRLAAVAQHKAELIARAAAQREAMAEAAEAWQSHSRVLDRGMSVLRTLKAHPVLAGIGV
ncbi:MAG TPA: YqjK family protein, partial [Burkholderiales bacterium]|nr:YqjK family protein [Burkholderiales bacterium]